MKAGNCTVPGCPTKIIHAKGLCKRHYHAERRPQKPAECRNCGCTDADCSNCIARTGVPCHWVEPGLCSACHAPPLILYATEGWALPTEKPDGSNGLATKHHYFKRDGRSVCGLWFHRGQTTADPVYHECAACAAWVARHKPNAAPAKPSPKKGA